MAAGSASPWPLIFCHYGASDYLWFTLRCARRTNPGARLILLGDARNRRPALAAGWEHHDFTDYQSPAQDEFNRVYRDVSGRDHKYRKGHMDWARFVFERWYHVEGFALDQGIGRFWHFDSDTMVLRPLAEYEPALADCEFTVQCNGDCLNGVISTDLLSRFNAGTIALFLDAPFLAEQQREFDEENPGFAFTEMRAFDEFRRREGLSGPHLLNFSEAEAFDDAVMLDQGFASVPKPGGRRMKDVFSRGGRVWGVRDGVEIAFVTLNMSWVPLSYYVWVLDALDGGESRLADWRMGRLRAKWRMLRAPGRPS